MTVPANAARLVDSESIRIASNLWRTPTANKAPAIHRPTEIGTTFQLDGFGHVGTKAAGGANTYDGYHDLLIGGHVARSDQARRSNRVHTMEERARTPAPPP